MSAAFWSSWFPNIVCTVGGCVLSWWIGYGQGKRATAAAGKQIQMLTTILLDLEEKGKLVLARDGNGNITGARIRSVAFTDDITTSSTLIGGTLTKHPGAAAG